VTYAGRPPSSAAERDAFLCETARAWRAQHPCEDLRVIVTDLTFHESPSRFVVGDGAVIAPVGVNVPGLQEVLDVRASPPPIRLLHADGNTAVAWPYAGALHRDMHYRGLALVRRAAPRMASIPTSPTFDTLPDPWRVDGRLTAEDLDGEEHGLDECKAFA